VNPGFDPRHVMTAQMSLQSPRYRSSVKLSAFYQEALARIRRLPAVEAAAVISNLPVERGLNLPVTLLDGPLASQTPMANWRYVTADYFHVMKIPLMAGRYPEETDVGESASVTLVNQEFVRTFFPNADPIGKHVKTFRGSSGDRVRQIVGVVQDVK